MSRVGRLKRFLLIVFNTEFWGIVSLLYGIFSGVRDEFLPEELAQNLRLGGLFRMFDWYWFVITGLVLWAGSVAWKSSKNRLNPNRAENGDTFSGTFNSSPIVKSSNGDVAGRDVNKPSYTYNYGINGVDKKELVVQIGIAVQQFKNEFNKIPYANKRNRVEIYNRAIDVFSKIETELIYRAKITLRGTSILELLNQLKDSFEKYGNHLLLYWSYQDQEYSYIQNNEIVPENLKGMIRENELSLDAHYMTIGIIVNKIVDNASEGDEWYML